MTKFDAIVIGNSILGLTTAYFLNKFNPSLKIAIIGKDSRDGAASIAAGAMLNYMGEITKDTMSNNYSIKKLESAILSGKLWPDYKQELNEQLPNDKKIKIYEGTYVILNSKSGSLDTDNFHAMLKACAQYKEPYYEIDPRDVKGLNPLDDCRPLRSIYLPNEGCVNSSSVINALKYILTSKGVNFFDNLAIDVSEQNKLITSVTLCDGQILTGNNFVLAAGAFSQKIIDKLSIKDNIPQLFAGIGIACVASKPNLYEKNSIQNVIRTPNRAGACGLHVLPRDDKSLYIGATNNVMMNPTTAHKFGLTQFLLKCAIDQVDQNIYSSEILGWHVGNRPVSIDSMPIIGNTSISNLHILTGTYRDGFHQSPFYGQKIASAITNNDNSVFDKDFLPERELIKLFKSKDDCIREIVTHCMAGFYEHEMRLPRVVSESFLIEMLYAKFRSLYEELETEFPINPDFLLMLEFNEHNRKECINSFKNYFKQKESAPA